MKIFIVKVTKNKLVIKHLVDIMVSREGSNISEGALARQTQVVTSSMLLDQINRGRNSSSPIPSFEDLLEDDGPSKDPNEPWLDEDHVADTQRFISQLDNIVADFIVE